MLKLPKPSFKAGEMSVAQALGERRSVREFEGTDLDMQTLSRLLWAAQGITDRKQNFRAAPSAGATYPLETYVLTASGVFHYLPGEHALQRVSDTDRRRELSSAALGQRWVAEAAVDIVFTAVYERTVERYGQRGRMYVHMEVGHAAENVLLQAVSLGLGSVPVGAFHNDKVSEVLNLPDNQTPLYIIPVGKPDRT
ncbi:MAG: SagB/ThcOx family dehydrogenase [Candidatus Pacebacteria bacterium]|nr:SagB/ThcOx family dehydrogenase [Candidatus Paceibacterota bacterium]